ncbi:hypothetical protein KUM39_25115 [Streptomyces sp. J2-1]|uniref:isocitrate/isopropylmalate family dehydrogenase n=1 Tax=Streptomyces corallincola TaxID=2851888 RepID=UPI001C390E9F|nr:isocitrate/isopropylmalate family dehydrogenase [Streptomyces corallincola]MBV2357605.1 hypothetical protein [Streptomyces corallincola]
MNRKTVAVLPGDGIGPEVLDAALPVIDALDLPIDLTFGDIGWECWRTEGTPVPDRTWDLIGRSDAVLLGATTSKPRREALADLAPELHDSAPAYVSPIIQLRQRLDLFANLRPVENYLGGGAPYRFCVVRENTEGLYAGLDWNHVPDAMWPLVAEHPNVRRSGRVGASASIRLQTSHGLDRILRFAFETARSHGYERVTLADKPNVLRHSSAYVLERLENIATDYPEIPFEVLNVDAVALWMARRPERFGVIVAENMFGDILSDLGGGVMGGLGLAPSANIGESGNYFEPVHGSAPAMVGRGRANPAAAFLTIGLLLEHLGFKDVANRVQDAVRHVTRRRDRVTYDLGGVATTTQAAQAVIDACREVPHRPTAAVVTIGDELLRGDLEDSNAANASRMLAERGIPVRVRHTVGDDETVIVDAVRPSVGRDDVIVLMGGLGPTSDDVTRSAMARALGRPLEHREEAWQGVVKRLTRFGVAIHDDNRRQALFAEGTDLLPNPNGTAWGCRAQTQGSTVIMLPGPPRECLPMLENVLRDDLPHLPAPPETTVVLRRTLGIIEADAAALVDALVRDSGMPVKPAYRWHYPYVDIRLDCPPAAAADLAKRLDTAISNHTVTDRDRTAVQELALLLDERHLAPDLDDRLTDGLLATELADARTRTHEEHEVPHPLAIHLSGVWQGGDRTTHTGTVTLTCVVRDETGEHTATSTIPNRGPEVTTYFAQFAAWSAARHLTGRPRPLTEDPA